MIYNVRVVLHQQDAFSSIAARSRRPALPRSWGFAVEAAQIHLRSGALARLAVQNYVSAGLPHEPVHLAQSESGALTRDLRRVERFEGPFQNLLAHAAPGVRHRNEQVLPWLDVVVRAAVGLVEV